MLQCCQSAVIRFGQGGEPLETTPKIKINDSVFTNLFRQKRYMRELYLALHPDDSIAEDELETVTIENVLVDDIYNDLGFLAKGTLITMVEAQSTWNWNMALRLLMYYVATIRNDYVGKDSEKLYGAGAIDIPRPEMYVVYTGDRVDRPETITLSDAHFHGEKCDVEVTVHMLYGGNGHDILSQYVDFTRITGRWTKEHGRTAEALRGAIAECREMNILKDYLSEHESEVLDIMTTLFNQENLTNRMMDNRYQQGVADGEARGEARGDSKRLVIAVEGIITHYHASLADACAASRCTVEEYYQAKNLLAKDEISV